MSSDNVNANAVSSLAPLSKIDIPYGTDSEDSLPANRPLIDEEAVAGNVIFEQVFIQNPCYCECPLQENVDWIAALEFLWGLSNAILCIVTLAITEQISLPEFLQQFADSEDRLTNDQKLIIRAATFFHVSECILAWLLMVGSSHRIKCLCIFWMVGASLTMIGQIVLVAMANFVATYMGVVPHPFTIYFIYVVWALVKQIKAFPGGNPIPIVRQVINPIGGGIPEELLRKKGKSKRQISSPIPLLLPTTGWGYYPYYYAALDHGFYSGRHPYYLHENVGGAAAAVADSHAPRRSSWSTYTCNRPIKHAAPADTTVAVVGTVKVKGGGGVDVSNYSFRGRN